MAKFKPGQSGNPKGRVRGSKNKVTLYREQLLESLPDVLEKIIASAKRGSPLHVKMVMDRTLSPLRPQDSPIRLRLRGSLEDKSQTILNAVSDGRITPDEGGKLMKLLADQSKIIETHELAERLKAIEELLKNENG